MEFAEIIEQMAICQPAIRTVVIHGFCDGPEPQDVDYRIYPVLAIRTFIRHQYHARADGGERRAGKTHEDMVRLGWDQEFYTDLITEAVYADNAWGLIGTSDDRVSGRMPDCQVVACPWPPEEDGVRLATIIGEMKDEVIRNYIDSRKWVDRNPCDPASWTDAPPDQPEPTRCRRSRTAAPTWTGRSTDGRRDAGTTSTPTNARTP